MKRVAGNAKRAKNIKIEKANPARKSRFERAGYSEGCEKKLVLPTEDARVMGYEILWSH